MRIVFISLFVLVCSSGSAQMFTNITPANGIPSGYYSTAQFVDVDNDGDIDIVVTTESGTNITYNDDMDFSNTRLFEDFITERQQPSVMDLGDFDLDGRVDILSGGGPNYSTFRVLLNKDPEYKPSKGTSTVQVTRGPASFGDFDNDGDLDVLVDYNNAAYTNIGDSLVYSYYYVYIRDLYSVYWMDFNKDGRLETLASSGSYGTYHTYILTKDSTKHEPVVRELQGFPYGIGGAKFADIDSDGDIDMLARTDVWRIYWNSNGSFSTGPEFSYASSAAIGDMNNDGKYDIILGGVMEEWQNFYIRIYANNGSSFTKIDDTSIDQTEERTHFDIADIDNDGDLDIVGVNPGKLYLNNTVTTNARPGVPVNLSETVSGINAIFHWTAPADDHTGTGGLTYNVDLRKTNGDVVVPSHSMPDGKRLITKMGNAFNADSYRIGCLEEGNYTWKVQALDAAWVGSEFSSGRSFSVSNVKPSAPANLQATPVTDRAIELTWTDSPNETSYVIQKKYAMQDTWYDFDTIPANITSYIDTAYLEPNTSYKYRVVAYNCAYLNEFGSEITGVTLPKLFEQSSRVPFIPTSSTSNLADVDNDGDLDILLTNNGSDKTVLLKFDGSLMRDSGIEMPDVAGHFVKWMDFNGDGFLDLVTDRSGINYTAMKVYISDQGNSFTAMDLSIDLSSVVSYTTRQAWADYDLDGDMDVAIVGRLKDYQELETRLFENRGNYFFKETELELKGIMASSDAWADYDRDGDMDLLAVTSSCGGNIVIFENSGNGAFERIDTQLGSILADVNGRTSSLQWVDVNNDGYPDLFMAGRTGCDDYYGSIRLYINNQGTGFFEGGGVDKIKAVYDYINVNFGDINLDGTKDVLVYGNTYSGSTKTNLYLNNNGNFERTKVSYLPDYGYTGNMQLGDFDGDDDLDLFIGGAASWTSNVYVAYENNMVDSWGGSNDAPSVPTNLVGEVKGQYFEMSWDGSNDDTTPAQAITYDVSVAIDDQVFVASRSNIDGSRRLVADGNNGTSMSMKIRIGKTGTLKWGVQAVDASYKASAAATAQATVDISVGLEGEPVAIQVYPNPAKDKVFVSSGLGAPQVFDVVGKRVFVPTSFNGDVYEIDTKELGAGLYIIRVAVVSKKIEITR